MDTKTQNIEILKQNIFVIDIDLNTVKQINQEDYNTDLISYLKGLVQLITLDGKGRSFHFDRDTTEVKSLINKIFITDSDFSSITTIIAQRLLDVEKSAQDKIRKLGVEIQKGIIAQAIIAENGLNKFIICKADHSDFLDENNFKYTRGLPVRKKIFKAFICTAQKNNLIDNIIVYDTNPSSSLYWWKDFLELTKVFSDEDNTVNAFESIDKSIFTKMKKIHPQDYVYLRNSAVRYFRSHESFDLDEYLETSIGKYKPYDDKLIIEELKLRIRELPKKNKFDNQFNIVKEKIKARFINKIPLTDEIELHLKSDIANIENIITAILDKDGTKYVKIKSEQGYQYFNKKKN